MTDLEHLEIRAVLASSLYGFKTHAHGGEIMSEVSQAAAVSLFKTMNVCAALTVSEPRIQPDSGLGAPERGCQSKTLSRLPGTQR